MIQLIFVLLFITLMIAWRGYRQSALLLFSLNFIYMLLVFIHHMTDTIGLSL